MFRDDSAAELTAVIVDQLSLTAPGEEFARDATAQLEATGYKVDYIPGKSVTVDFYRTLPKAGYDLVLLRAHSSAEITRGEESVASVSLFTNEPYDAGKYRDDQQSGRIGFASYTDEGPQYFGVTADFVKETMEGDFGGALVIMMGCDGLRNERAGEAFVGRGARAFISWSQLVSAEHTDLSTDRLLTHLLVDGLEPAQAVTRTMDEVGPDPAYGAVLRSYSE